MHQFAWKNSSDELGVYIKTMCSEIQHHAEWVRERGCYKSQMNKTGLCSVTDIDKRHNLTGRGHWIMNFN